MSVQNQLSEAAGTALGLATSWAGPFAPLIAVIGWGVTQAYLPDVYIGVNFNKSDRLKSLAYHEIAHASHFTQVGSSYWEELVIAEIFANGHGDQNSDGAELIAVCESWADYIGGHLYVDRTYGGNFSGIRSWEDQLERTWNESQNHIPVGLYHDLVDVGESSFISGGISVTACNQADSGCTTIADQVSGFSNVQMFSCLTPLTFTIEQFRDCLITNHLGSTSNTAAQVNTLFNSYQ
ncbi:MAG: hypothetical protein DHS20C18_46760 [Saprospiraceae bacterium]|nr:MAG: hypothetical protein DHS20C18_46760 [Saprospiraceae bacterium]